MKKALLIRALSSYQRELWKQIEFHAQLKNEGLRKVIFNEVKLVEDVQEKIEKSVGSLTLKGISNMGKKTVKKGAKSSPIKKIQK